MIRWKTEGTALYQQLPKQLFNSWKNANLCAAFPPTALFNRLRIKNLERKQMISLSSPAR